MNSLRWIPLLLVVALAGTATWLQAEVKMSPLFGDHMVLQQAMSLPVWGTADANEKVTVTIGQESATTTAAADGKWMVKLAPLPVSNTPVTMTVKGTNTLTFTDVLIGEVWVCSGQSNMEFGIGRRLNPAAEIAEANVPLLRLFTVPKTLALTPQSDMKIPAPVPPATENVMLAHWQVCTPDSIAQEGTWTGFSAVGYFFGREIQKVTGGPVGLIQSSWGGTPAEAWTSVEGLNSDPALAEYVTRYKTAVEAYAKKAQEFPAKKADFVAAMAQWNKDVKPGYEKTVADWKIAVEQARVAGQPLPPKPVANPLPPKGPTDPTGGSNSPTNLYNAMIAPLLPYGIKGVIWYQGEGNANAAGLYRILFPAMITDWRKKWGEGNFPFLFVQLAGYDPGKSWPFLREAQLKTLSLPNTAMATAIDVGDPVDIHPKDKVTVGLRLALAAQHLAYGKGVVYSGPIYDKMTIEGNKVRLSFTQEGGGLVIGAPPTYAANVKPPPTDKLVGFVIAGEDKKWVPADAKIEGKDVVVSSAEVPTPVAVRYAWEATPAINFYNKEGLPASSFRTDNWEEVPAVPATPPSPAPAAKP